MIPRITRSRTQLRSHLNTYDNGAHSFFVSSDVYPQLFDHLHPEITRLSPTGWKTSSNGAMKYLWFPELDAPAVATIDDWKARFQKYVLLGLNPHIETSFSDELDFCMALDFNFDPAAEKRTLFGEAEFQAKYRDGNQEVQVLGHALKDAIGDLPIPPEFAHNLCMTCVPAVPDVRTIPRRLATGVAKLLPKDFVDATLHCPKSALKQANVAEKSQIWQDLYNRDCVQLSAPVKDRLVIIVDDLYQSGVTMWAYAKFLKSQGAAHVLGLPCVKSLRDSDNT